MDVQVASRVTKPKRFRRKRQRKPGELRNRIYKYALLEHEEIGITSKGPGQPSLLRVCRGIRREATGIYYSENNFKLYVEDYKGADFAALGRHSSHYCYRDTTSNITFGYIRRPKPNWDNPVKFFDALQSYSLTIPG